MVDKELVAGIVDGYTYIVNYINTKIKPYLLPLGGITAQAVAKNSSADGDYKFKTIAPDNPDGSIPYIFNSQSGDVPLVGGAWTTITSIQITAGKWSIWAYACIGLAVGAQVKYNQHIRIRDNLGNFYAYAGRNGMWPGATTSVERVNLAINNLIITTQSQITLYLEAYELSTGVACGYGSYVSGNDSLNYVGLAGRQNFLTGVKVG